MTIDKKVTQDLFGYKSVPCLDCEGKDLNQTQKILVMSVKETGKL
jgi:hypothetical protein